MEKGINKLLIVLSILSLFIYPFSIYGSVLLGATALILSLLLVKEKETTSKVLQPFVFLCLIVVIRSVFTLILGMIQKFALVGTYNSNLMSSISKTLNIIDAIIYIALILFIIVAIVFMLLNKDIPLVSNITNKLVGIESAKEPKSPKDNKKNKKQTTIIIDATNKNKSKPNTIEKDQTNKNN